MKESSLVFYKPSNFLNDFKIIDYQIGTASTVDFDYFKIKKFINSKGENFIPDCLNFIHVHPPGVSRYSVQDFGVMKGYQQMIGSTFPFHIVLFKNENIYDTNRDLLSYFYCSTIDDILVCPVMYTVPEHVFIILKTLSYMQEKSCGSCIFADQSCCSYVSGEHYGHITEVTSDYVCFNWNLRVENHIGNGGI